MVLPNWLTAAKEWCERVIYCHHNARVLADMEWRLSCVLDAATGGQMSKPYYAWDAMRSVISDHHQRHYEDGVTDGIETVVEGAKPHIVDLEQCAIFVDSPPLKKSMTDAAGFLKSIGKAPF